MKNDSKAIELVVSPGLQTALKELGYGPCFDALEDGSAEERAATAGYMELMTTVVREVAPFLLLLAKSGLLAVTTKEGEHDLGMNLYIPKDADTQFTFGLADFECGNWLGGIRKAVDDAIDTLLNERDGTWQERHELRKRTQELVASQLAASMGIGKV